MTPFRPARLVLAVLPAPGWRWIVLASICVAAFVAAMNGWTPLGWAAAFTLLAMPLATVGGSRRWPWAAIVGLMVPTAVINLCAGSMDMACMDLFLLGLSAFNFWMWSY